MGDARGADKTVWPLFRGLEGARWASVGRDLGAGLALAAIAVPGQMATARLAGVQPQAGLIAFVAASLGFAVFGANRILSAGADSTVAPIFAGSLALMAASGSPQYADLAAALALMVGIMLALGALLRLGWIADLLSRPVTTGFLAGIAVHIVISQAPSALGLPDESGDVYHRLGALGTQVGHANWIAAALTLAVFAVAFGAERLSPRIPGALVALVGATAATAWLGLERRGVRVLGVLPGGLPRLQPPHLSLETFLPLVGLATVVALVAMVQTAATTRSFGAGQRDPDVDRDFLGVGLGGVLAGLFGAFPVNASPPNTAVVSQSGGRSQLGALAAALAVLLLAVFGGGLLKHAPTAALAGVLLFIAQRIVRWSDFADLSRRAPVELALALITCVLIVLLPIETGVAIGIFVALGHGVFTITRARLVPFERVAGTTVWWPAAPDRRGETLPQVLVMGFQAPLSFLNAYEFRRGVANAIATAGSSLRLFVLEASNIVEVDVTAADILADLIGETRAGGVEVAVARLESVRAETALARFGVLDLLGRDHVFRSVAEAIATLVPSPSLKADGPI